MVRPSAADTPLLRVSRPVSACSRCRSAKIKCDGALPACTACVKSGRSEECSSANDQFAKGKERSYVASLEARIEKLEKRLAYAQQRRSSVSMLEDTSAESPDRKDSLATIRGAIQDTAAKRRETTDVNELVSDFGFLSVNATMRDFESSTTNMTFARLILAASINAPIPQVAKRKLPSRPAAMALIQIYLDKIYSLFPAFLETTVFLSVDLLYRDDGRTTDFDRWLVYMILAIASTSQSRSKSDQFYKDGLAYVATALIHADEVLIPGSIYQIQSLVLLVQYAMFDPAHFDSWQLIGFACRSVVDLGFHQDPPEHQQPEKQKLELRRKIFYCVYSLDRSISMVHARTFSFIDDATCVAIPQAGPLAKVKTSMGTSLGYAGAQIATRFFELRRIQSKWYQELFQSKDGPLPEGSSYVWGVCQEMRSWSKNMPPDLPLSIDSLFKLELLYSSIYCLTPNNRMPEVTEMGKTLIFEYSIAYMLKMHPISQEVNTAFYTYHDALRVYFIGSQFISILTANLTPLLAGHLPFIPVTTPGSPPPPPIPNQGRSDNVERSICAIEQVIDTLKTFGERWEDSKSLQAGFTMQSQGLLNELYARRGSSSATSRRQHNNINHYQ